MIESAAIFLAKKFGFDYLKKKTQEAIGSAQDRRAKAFVEGFFSAVAEDKSEEEVTKLLETILEDEKQSEVLFDAYRHIALSKSREIGPRAIGLLTAAILAEKRTANDDEERWFSAFELLSDGELIGAEDYIRYCLDKAKDVSNKNYKSTSECVFAAWSEDNNESGREMDSTPLNLFIEVGSWAGKMGNLGMIFPRLTETTTIYGNDTSRGRMNGTLDSETNQKYWIVLPLSLGGFQKLIVRAYAMLPAEKQDPKSEMPMNPPTPKRST